MSATTNDATSNQTTGQPETLPSVPKKIVNAQTVCNEKNAKGKLCNGHIKQLKTGGEAAEVHLRGDDVLFKCQVCGTLYMGPPLGHLRDPDKQSRFVEKELAALLQAAGGTLPVIQKDDRGVFVMVEAGGAHHASAPVAASAQKIAPVKTTAPAKAAAPADAAPEQKRERAKAGADARRASSTPIPGASGPVPGETREQKLARLRGVVAEAKRRKAAAGDGEAASTPTAADAVVHTTPTAATTSGTDSSPAADAHRPAAEAQAATGYASAAPLSPSAATASPVAGPESPADLAPDTVPRTSTTSPAPAKMIAPGPVPGETHEQKIARLKATVAAAKERAEREGKAKPN